MYRMYRTPANLKHEHKCPICDAGFKLTRDYAECVWNEDKGEWQLLKMTEEKFNALQKLKEEYKKKYDTFRELYIIIRENAVEPDFMVKLS